jgi:plastocyanin
VRAAASIGLALALGCLAWPAADAAGGESAGAVVRGSVKVLKKGLFGRIGESDDRSGVLVYITGYDEPAPSDVAQLAQQNERFAPRILPIVAGQTVSFPNRDRLYHNVFSVAPTLSFDLGQYKSSDPPRTQVFAKPGLVPVYCNIHPQMISYVVVLENRAFALTGEDGAFELRGVRAGRHALNAWMPGAQRVTRELELEANQEVGEELVLEQTQAIPPHLRKDGTPYPADKPYGDD